jgi:hypothetical protein
VLRNHAEEAEIRFLAGSSAIAFAGVDLWYALTGRISTIYLADVVPQAIFMAGVALSTRRR